MKPKHQRLWLAGFAAIAIIGAGVLASMALKEKASYFFTPSELMKSGSEAGKVVRLGGMVQKGSVFRDAKTLTVNFVVNDTLHAVPVSYRGITPDLFKEGSGVIAEGRLSENGQFVADNLLAKHDEKYVPPDMAKKMGLMKKDKQ